MCEDECSHISGFSLSLSLLELQRNVNLSSSFGLTCEAAEFDSQCADVSDTVDSLVQMNWLWKLEPEIFYKWQQHSVHPKGHKCRLIQIGFSKWQLTIWSFQKKKLPVWFINKVPLFSSQVQIPVFLLTQLWKHSDFLGPQGRLVFLFLLF